MKLELRGITKRFGSLVANDHIDLTVEPGEIHCLLGENGAGKSTLMNVLYGLYEPTEGEIVVDGTPRTFKTAGDAIDAGIGMVHQHFMLVPVFTVAENVMLGHEETRTLGWLDRRRARKRVLDLVDEYGLKVDPDMLVEDLPVGLQQRVEILKALVRDAKVLILDEPTAVLTPQETEELFRVMRALREAGHSIVFITHKLKEVKAVADRITVIRRGKIVGTADPASTEKELASLMVGRPVKLVVDKTEALPGAVRFSIDDLTVLDDNGTAVVDRVDLQLREGEILGIAGVDGNGQTELTQAILGLRKPAAGTISLDGHDLAGRTPRQILHAGVGFVPEDRQHDGIVGDFTVAENLVLDLVTQPPFGKRGSIVPSAVRDNARRRVEEFDIRTQTIESPAGTLSGGNQQKVVVARELSRPLRLFIASQPTRGVDVGAMEFIHKRIVAERDVGTPVIIVSTELDEVVALADWIAVMYRGRIVGIVPPDTSRGDLGLLMAGVEPSTQRGDVGGATAAGATAVGKVSGPGKAIDTDKSADRDAEAGTGKSETRDATPGEEEQA
ncbi:ABC transporter ATP-binding protein [Streptomyces sp. SID3343]|uniref:ABC transporter ATP-binding protein n=1 Tax=Streptomyces sp. SID3343 TaxID=2690260 RepID=UPI00136DB358|nr:ABC transporter ATP-binding protein [Streptomyces sp. SID3343]MYW04227.1 ATP-binding cassette domain-containing protein [Streptomyces sp. SID3343]